MQRREFSTGLLTAGLASPVILSGDKSFATSGGGEGGYGNEVARLSRVLLILGLRRIIISYLLIFNPLALLGLNLRSPVPQFSENRLSSGKAPILGGLFRPSLQDRFNPAAVIGQVFLWQSLLIIAPRRGPVSNMSRVVIAHRNLSWQPKPKPRKMRMSNIPTLGAIKKNGLFLGDALQTKRELLIVVKPSIVKMGS